MIKFVICSYNRPALIKKKTLLTLTRANIPAESIFIFAGADSDPDFARYAALEADGYHVIRAPVGLANARNMALDCFLPGEHLVFMDDDVSGFIHVSPTGFDLAQECQTAFDLCYREGCSLWGAYPVPCKLWMANHALKGALFIQGCFFGLVNPGAEYRHELSFKEDWARTLFFWKKEGAVIRFENFAPSRNTEATLAASPPPELWKPRLWKPRCSCLSMAMPLRPENARAGLSSTLPRSL